MTVPEVAATLRVGRTTIYRLINDGRLRYVIVGETKRIRPEDLEEYLAASDPTVYTPNS